jgi:hypothetical protein
VEKPVGLELPILTLIPDWATLRGARRLAYADSRMKDFLLILLHLAVTTAKLCGPGGVRAMIAENLVLKQQLIVLRRGRRRAPSLTMSDRLLCQLWAIRPAKSDDKGGVVFFRIAAARAA